MYSLKKMYLSEKKWPDSYVSLTCLIIEKTISNLIVTGNFNGLFAENEKKWICDLRVWLLERIWVNGSHDDVTLERGKNINAFITAIKTIRSHFFIFLFLVFILSCFFFHFFTIYLCAFIFLYFLFSLNLYYFHFAKNFNNNKNKNRNCYSE